MPFTHTTAELLEEMRISDSTLRRMRATGLFQPGVHFRANGVGVAFPRLVWDPAAVSDALAAHTRQAIPAQQQEVEA